MAQPAKCLPCKHQDLSSVPQDQQSQSRGGRDEKTKLAWPTWKF